ncbi:N2,N2-dimethylguanosine tRNA methyltransferase [Synechococcus sp. MIT S9509]|uniref:N2,N2-dimethylguanosine tRNA methyltransferase n=1 Tax=Synechococcus sp. MIT S9509 TaxID=1801630 RepID=UPI003515432C
MWASPQSAPVEAGWRAVACTRLETPVSHYREGAVCLQTGSGFFRKDSRPSRDISVLLATHQASEAQRPLRWLDLMAGCGIRGLRWGLEALPQSRPNLELWSNDADPDRSSLLASNLQPLQSVHGLSLITACSAAERLLRQAYLDQTFFDLIDLDAFGCPNALLQSALAVLRLDGLLILASTDGRSPTGHDRPAAVRHFGAAARVHPASWELALRLQLAVLAREAWQLGRGLEPLACFSEGRTFRLAVRLRQRVSADEELQLGLLARCERCGDQAVQPLLRLSGWRSCRCCDGQGRWAVTGPLWIGHLQKPALLVQLLNIADLQPITLSSAGRRLLQRLQRDCGLPVCCWSTAELASRLSLAGPPPLDELVGSLLRAGHQACPSAVMTGQLRTDAPLAELLQQCVQHVTGES